MPTPLLFADRLIGSMWDGERHLSELYIAPQQLHLTTDGECWKMWPVCIRHLILKIMFAHTALAQATKSGK